MRDDPFPRHGRVLRIRRRHRLVAPDCLRRKRDGHSHSVLLTALVLAPPEVRDHEVRLHLKSSQDPRKILLSALAEPGFLLQFRRQDLLIAEYRVPVFVLPDVEIHDPLLAPARKPVLPPRVEIVPVSSEIHKIRQPREADEPRLAVEEFAVGHLPVGGDDLAPLPRVFPAASRPPIPRRGVFLHGKSFHLVAEQRNKSDLIDPRHKLLPRADPPRVIPGEAAHDPLSVF